METVEIVPMETQPVSQKPSTELITPLGWPISYFAKSDNYSSSSLSSHNSKRKRGKYCKCYCHGESKAHCQGHYNSMALWESALPSGMELWEIFLLAMFEYDVSAMFNLVVYIWMLLFELFYD